ncbi:MAG: hypothetical protein ACRC5N_06150, partial [Plesiomonas sp.]
DQMCCHVSLFYRTAVVVMKKNSRTDGQGKIKKSPARVCAGKYDMLIKLMSESDEKENAALS